MSENHDVFSVCSIESYDFSEQVGYLLRRVYQRHTALFQKLVSEAQLTVGQFVVLCAVRDSGACSMSHIVRQAVIDPATVRGIVERLKSRGLLEVIHDQEDRRKVLVSLTPEGTGLLKSTIPLALDISDKTLQAFNPAERLVFIYLLQKLCNAETPEDLGD